MYDITCLTEILIWRGVLNVIESERTENRHTYDSQFIWSAAVESSEAEWYEGLDVWT